MSPECRHSAPSRPGAALRHPLGNFAVGHKEQPRRSGIEKVRTSDLPPGEPTGGARGRTTRGARRRGPPAHRSPHSGPTCSGVPADFRSAPPSSCRTGSASFPEIHLRIALRQGRRCLTPGSEPTSRCRIAGHLVLPFRADSRRRSDSAAPSVTSPILPAADSPVMPEGPRRTSFVFERMGRLGLSRPIGAVPRAVRRLGANRTPAVP
jgi:hypothetical protein